MKVCVCVCKPVSRNTYIDMYMYMSVRVHPLLYCCSQGIKMQTKIEREREIPTMVSQAFGACD